MNRTVIGLGSNLHPEENILTARLLLSKKFSVIKETLFCKTRSIQNPRQEFLNGCVYLHTALNQEELRHELKRIERQMGRDPDAPEGEPYPIDLDIVIWNDQIADRSFYTQPHLKESVLELLPGLKV